MKRLMITLGLAFPSLAPAWAADTQALMSAATGQAFSVGTTPFQLVPDASLRTANPSDPAKAASVDGFDITLPDPRARRTAKLQAAPTGGPQVAMDMHAGAPALVMPRLRVYGATARQLDRIAKTSGARVLAAPDAGSKGLLGFASVESALAALSTVKAAPGVEDAEVDLVQAIRTPR